MNQVIEAEIFTEQELKKKELMALQNGASTLPFVIAKRRQRESYCLQQARCLALSEPLFSLYFESCLSEEKKQAD